MGGITGGLKPLWILYGPVERKAYFEKVRVMQVNYIKCIRASGLKVTVV